MDTTWYKNAVVYAVDADRFFDTGADAVLAHRSTWKEEIRSDTHPLTLAPYGYRWYRIHGECS